MKWSSGLLGLALAPVLTAGGRLERFESAEPAMGTLARITVYAGGEAAARKGFTAAHARIGELDSLLSDYKPDSELNRLCRRAGEAVPVSEDLFRVLEHAQRLARQTEGAFDATLGPLARLWREARRLGRPPDAAALDAARRLTGFEKLRLDPAARTATLAAPGMQLDLGGIAKGYAAGEALDVLRGLGLTRALVAIGGDVCLGDPPAGGPGWRIGIQSAGRVAVVDNTCVSTSGGSEQFLETGGVRYSHILDPETGLGVRHDRMVTVQAPEGMLADSLATALSVLPAERGERLLKLYPRAKLY